MSQSDDQELRSNEPSIDNDINEDLNAVSKIYKNVKICSRIRWYIYFYQRMVHNL